MRLPKLAPLLWVVSITTTACISALGDYSADIFPPDAGTTDAGGDGSSPLQNGDGAPASGNADGGTPDARPTDGSPDGG